MGHIAWNKGLKGIHLSPKSENIRQVLILKEKAYIIPHLQSLKKVFIIHPKHNLRKIKNVGGKSED